MRDRNIVVKIDTFNGRGGKVLEGSAEVAQPTTVYVFTGQDSESWIFMTTLLLLAPSGR
jgi:fatty acid synthase subunit alpha